MECTQAASTHHKHPHPHPNPQAATMAKHHADLIFCRKQPGIAIGRLCEKYVLVHAWMCVLDEGERGGSLP